MIVLSSDHNIHVVYYNLMRRITLHAHLVMYMMISSGSSIGLALNTFAGSFPNPFFKSSSTYLREMRGKWLHRATVLDEELLSKHRATTTVVQIHRIETPQSDIPRSDIP